MQENELDRAPASEDHDSIMSDVDTSDASDDQNNSSRATPELPMSNRSSTTNPNSKPAKVESHENSKSDIEMTDVAIEKSQHKSPTVKTDPAMETASETYLKSGLVQSTPRIQPSKNYLASDPNKLQVINTFDSRKVKEPTEA